MAETLCPTAFDFFASLGIVGALVLLAGALGVAERRDLARRRADEDRWRAWLRDRARADLLTRQGYGEGAVAPYPLTWEKVRWPTTSDN